MRFINQIVAPTVGTPFPNRDLVLPYQQAVERLPLPEAERKQLAEFVAFQFVGERTRHGLTDYTVPTQFALRAANFERAADQALDRLTAEIQPTLASARAPLDAIVTTTATGNLMPGLGYRLAHRLGDRVRPDALILDLANVGCTGSIQALKLAQSLAPSYRQILVAAVEVPSTLLNLEATAQDAWQGNCTFGDGAAALWLTDDPEAGSLALRVEDIHPRQFAVEGLDLIRWGYQGYYHFALRDHRTFEGDVRRLVQLTLTSAEGLWREEHSRWAIHPAGIALLMRLARSLGLAPEIVQPAIDHYRRFSNMSSVGILHILNDVSQTAPVGTAINLLTMGAGFTVIYGKVRRVR